MRATFLSLVYGMTEQLLKSAAGLPQHVNKTCILTSEPHMQWAVIALHVTAGRFWGCIRLQTGTKAVENQCPVAETILYLACQAARIRRIRMLTLPGRVECDRSLSAN